MRCIFCNQPIRGNDGISLSGKGISHKVCHQIDLTQRRMFKKLNISSLTDQELTDLKDLVLAEENSRNDQESDVELF